MNTLLSQAQQALSNLELMVSALELGEKDLKGAKAVVLHLSEKAPDEFKTRLTTLAKVRTKKAFGQLVDTFTDYVKDLEESSKSDSVFDKLESCATKISELLAARMQNSLDLGLVLTEAKEQFSKQADFLKWAKEACNLGKSQVYKWVKVYEVFGAEPAFRGVAMSVLYHLASLGNESPEFKAAEQVLDDGGTLDLPELKQIIADCSPEPAPAPAPTKELDLVESASTNIEQIVVEETAPEQEGDPIEDEAAPFEPDTTDDLFRPIGGEPEAAPEPQTAPQTDSRDELIKGLQDQIKALTEELSKRNQPAPEPTIAQLPALPQFDLADPYAVLGLSEKLAPTSGEIKKAHRTLAKLYSNQPEVSAKLKAARDQLV